MMSVSLLKSVVAFLESEATSPTVVTTVEEVAALLGHPEVTPVIEAIVAAVNAIKSATPAVEAAVDVVEEIITKDKPSL